MKKRTGDLPGVSGPGVSAKVIKEIDEAFAEYVPLVDKRVKITPKEVAAKTKVVTAILKHAAELGADDKGVIHYRYDDKPYKITPGKWKVSKAKAESEVEVDEEDEK